MATYEYKGKWWLPGKEEDKVSGVLSYTPGESIELELIGNFSDSDKSTINNLFIEERVPVIYGQASEGSDISLFDCGNSIHRVFKADFSIAKYFPRYIAIGMLLPSINEKKFFKAKIIETAVSANREFINAFLGYKFAYYGFKTRTNILKNITVSEKCTGHNSHLKRLVFDIYLKS